MIIYPAIDPIVFRIFTWPVYWYGLMYLIGFVVGWGLLALRLRFSSTPILTYDQLSDVIFYTAMGVILGGRVGYMLFYDWRALLSHPLLLFQTWKGGMSFHGGLLGVIVALFLYTKRLRRVQKTMLSRVISLLELTDFIAPVVPIGLGAGRIGNFVNAELWGRTTNMPWGMIFPHAGWVPRHPSQLYEAGLEGLLLFLILWCYSRHAKPTGAVSGLFALGYGLFRCIAEFFREPDPQIGYIAFGWLTEGQLLSLPLILMGSMLLIWAYTRKA
jgi:phosphatidylglycerol:prolipoprotein diacylglycerol transferase